MVNHFVAQEAGEMARKYRFVADGVEQWVKAESRAEARRIIESGLRVEHVREGSSEYWRVAEPDGTVFARAYDAGDAELIARLVNQHRREVK